MLFNSFEFLLFLPGVFAAYWLLDRWTDRPAGLRLQNLLVLVASYVFYGWWDARFLGLIAFSTLVDYAVGLQIAKSRKPQRWLAVSLIVNLGLLGYFKYANFFIESWVDAWAAAGVTMNASTLQIILPVGISFYTFQTLSYSIDIYRRKLEPTKDLIAFAAFVSFFPQLVAGPIERAAKLLPQIQQRRHFNPAEAIEGFKMIVWGLFKKIVVADTCGQLVDIIFTGEQHMPAPMAITGAILFSFQIYGDFSGYSDIAIGTARLFGIRLMTNFRTPYFSRDIAEFWRRWHISLSTWFRDYLYIPLGGSRGSKWTTVRNTFAIFIVSGFWHGANWTFVIWGLVHALLFLPLLLMGRNRKHLNGDGFRASQIPSILLTFATVTGAWIFFRAESLGQAFHLISQCVAGRWAFPAQVSSAWAIAGPGIAAMLIGEAIAGALKGSRMWRDRWAKLPEGMRWVGLGLGLHVTTLIIVIFMRSTPPAFIYFQF